MTNGYPKQVLAEAKKFFEGEREHLKKRLSQIGEADPYKDPDHANDNADIGLDVREEMAHQESEANQAQIEKRLQEVEKVLGKIEDGSYGYCESCSKMIDTDRLSSNPLATLCIACASK